MLTKLEKIGDDVGVVIDESLLRVLQIDADTPLELKVEGDRLIVTPLKADTSGSNAGSSDD